MVFLLCGLWHGAAYTFVLWGVFHGLLLIVERLGFARVLGRSPRLLRHVYAMGAVMVGWVLFRADDLGQALAFYRAMAGQSAADQAAPFLHLVNHEQMLAFLLAFLFATPLVEHLGGRLRQLLPTGPGGTLPRAAARLHTCWRVLSLAGLFVLCYVYVLAGTYSPFLYFRF